MELRPEEITLHGRRVAYRIGGSGPPLILIHGITSSSETWNAVGRMLARTHTVLAPDLLGHGQTAKPRGDYSMGAFASGLRDLTVALGIGPATIVGHSLGGGVAMQYSYQFPERTHRLALVASGGLGAEVAGFLRAATLPGAELVIPLMAASRVLATGRAVGRLINRLGIQLSNDTVEIARGHASLTSSESRLAFVHTLRASIDPRGQRVRGTDRLYLAARLPVLIIWGARDRIIPVEHGRRAHEMVPGSRLVVFERAGHFPYLDEPERFVSILQEWIDGTEAGDTGYDQFRAAILASRRADEA
jgi:pimeloyl-ACP methyl ester carboxylesterase